jgi:dolichyl-phosphate beta-glucosyltransferase
MASAIIVIPCYNEATRLPVPAFRTFMCARYALRFLFVNDGSTDGTGQVLHALQAENPQRFSVHELPTNVGKAEAVRAGVLAAFAARPDYIGYWDADLATPLAAIPAFCEILEARPDLLMVFGARVRLLGRAIERQAVRHYLGRVVATAASGVLGLRIYDTQCGAKLFRAGPESHALFQEPFVTRWLFDIELLARLIQRRRGTMLPPVEEIIYELPLQEWRDVAGSKVRPSDFAKAFLGLARIHRQYLRSPRPMQHKRCSGPP